MKYIYSKNSEVRPILRNIHSPSGAYSLMPELDKLQISNLYKSDVKKEWLKIIVLNAQRGIYLEEIITYLSYHPSLKNADIIFLNELDNGMVRSGNINTAAELSRRLKMNYIYGIEFLELTKGNRNERLLPGQNTRSLHGNAILSRYILEDSFLLRLPLEYDWYNNFQKRIGSRIALITKIIIGSKELGLICTHLENKTGPAGRANQMNSILKSVKERFEGLPVVIGGDMNTNTFGEMNYKGILKAFIKRKGKLSQANDLEPYEPLFKLIENHGFDYKNANLPGKITFKKHLKGIGDLKLNIDWIFTKLFKCRSPAIVEPVFKRSALPGLRDLEQSENLEFSDHNAISAEITSM